MARILKTARGRERWGENATTVCWNVNSLFMNFAYDISLAPNNILFRYFTLDWESISVCDQQQEKKFYKKIYTIFRYIFMEKCLRDETRIMLKILNGVNATFWSNIWLVCVECEVVCFECLSVACRLTWILLLKPILCIRRDDRNHNFHEHYKFRWYAIELIFIWYRKI